MDVMPLITTNLATFTALIPLFLFKIMMIGLILNISSLKASAWLQIQP
jgi:hypothetical protein